jgi:anti-sigma regulatory factor (Ser/Thr protein kinase)
MKELKIEARIENLDTILAFVNVELEKVQCSPKIRRQIFIVTEELFVNIAHYAYTPALGFAIIRIMVSESEICLEFEDSGRPYNPLAKVDPDITASAEDRPIGGLGIFMVKKIMDTVEYRYDGDRNLLLIKKTIT